MARHTQGFVKTWRSMWDGDLGDNPYSFALFNVLLQIACWKESIIVWKGEKRKLPAGTAVFGMKEFADRWQCSRATISKWLYYLHHTERITLETSTVGCIATIRNWSLYQFHEEVPRTPSEHEVNTTRTRDVPRGGTYEEGRREEERKEITESSKIWIETLKHFGIERGLIANEDLQIARAIRAHGAAAVNLALRGAAFEESFKGFDPKKNVNLTRVFHPEKFQKFVNLGAQFQVPCRETYQAEAPC